MNIEIFPMTLEDLNTIAPHLEEDFDSFWSVTTLKAELQNPYNLSSYHFVAKIQNEIVGFCIASKVIDELEIRNIVTKKNKRNLGIASSLLEKLLCVAKECEVTLITLEVNCKNVPALHLYQKYHFEQVGLRKKYYNNTDDAILMNLKCCL